MLCCFIETVYGCSRSNLHDSYSNPPSWGSSGTGSWDGTHSSSDSNPARSMNASYSWDNVTASPDALNIILCAQKYACQLNECYMQFSEHCMACCMPPHVQHNCYRGACQQNHNANYTYDTNNNITNNNVGGGNGNTNINNNNLALNLALTAPSTSNGIFSPARTPTSIFVSA